MAAGHGGRRPRPTDEGDDAIWMQQMEAHIRRCIDNEEPLRWSRVAYTDNTQESGRETDMQLSQPAAGRLANGTRQLKVSTRKSVRVVDAVMTNAASNEAKEVELVGQLDSVWNDDDDAPAACVAHCPILLQTVAIAACCLGMCTLVILIIVRRCSFSLVQGLRIED
mmetsp:Transcript_40415/g.67143  ORF Transcript_40415/g.67143 Transcript_40415/m.67143 type:complete len:167 (+) Transcript_40415:83-583(+)